MPTADGKDEADALSRQPGWHFLSLGDALTATVALDEIVQQFAAADRLACNAAIFKRHDFSHSMHCEVVVYFSPAAAALAIPLKATPCERPDAPGLELLAGDSHCLNR